VNNGTDLFQIVAADPELGTKTASGILAELIADTCDAAGRRRTVHLLQ
jgi:hypothetical protein